MMDNFDKELAPIPSNPIDDCDTEMLSVYDVERQKRAVELESALNRDPKEAIQRILIDTIVHDQEIALRFNKTHGMTFINAVKQLAESAGVSMAAEMDVLIDLPEEPAEALKVILAKRAGGELKSKQAADLAALVEKLTQFDQLEELVRFVKELKDKDTSSQTTGIEIINREDVDNEKGE